MDRHPPRADPRRRGRRPRGRRKARDRRNLAPHTASGCHRLATALLTAGAAIEGLTVAVPPGAGFHLDLVVAMVDHHTFAVWAPVRHALRAHRSRATSKGVEVCAVPDPFSWLSASNRVIEIGSRYDEGHGRRWDHGTNVLALEPGVVVAYDDNHRANAQLIAAGMEVIPISGACPRARRTAMPVLPARP